MTVDRSRRQRAPVAPIVAPIVTPIVAPTGWSRRTKAIAACVAADLAMTAGGLWWLLS